MSQITVRGIPDELEKELRAQANRQGTSMNKTVLSLLKKAMGFEPAKTSKKRDLSGFSGRWSAEEARDFDKVLERFESIDEEVWK